MSETRSGPEKAAEKPLHGFRKETQRLAPEPIVVRVIVDGPIDRFTFVCCVLVMLSPIPILHFAGVTLKEHIAAMIGLVLAAVAVGLGFAKSTHTPLQRQLILALFALAGGAIATEIPGFLDIHVTTGEKTAIAASGALGVFLVLYLISARKPTE